jgi:hydroxymethylbilane synthase
VKARLGSLGHEVELHFITTTGDRTLGSLDAVGGKGAFLKEIEEALQAGAVDLAVHSLKDVPTALPPGLALAAVLERADPRDALVSDGTPLGRLPTGARVGTTSLRRRALLLRDRADLTVVDLRGNVDTRLRRRREGDFDAVILAMAGLLRLGREGEITESLDPDRFVPAPGQGAIGLETREGDKALRDALVPLHHVETAKAVTAERTLLAALGGGCNVPLGAHARKAGRDGMLRLTAFLAAASGEGLTQAEGTGQDPVELGNRVAAALLAPGAPTSE